MARSCGLRIGPRRFELIVLDGSPKRHKITSYHAGVFADYGDEDPVEAAVHALKAAVKEYSIPRESVGIAVDTSRAAFRQISLPFSDRSKIEQVIKFEVESELPQWNIDEVIVDFKVMEETSSSSKLLVTAVPKYELAKVLDLCESANMEPLEAEFETTAMVNAAMAADMCNLDDAQVLVHVGEFATSVVVVDSGEIREMRVIHIGALSHESAMAAAQGAATVHDEEKKDGESAEVDSDVEQESLSDENDDGPDPFEVRRRLEQTVKRIRRELGVTISGARTHNEIESIYVCGLELPGLIGSSVIEVPVYLLDCFDEDGGQPADGFGQLVVAYGAALRQLGSVRVEACLRREELKYSGAFERIEFPLAVACLLLASLLGVINILQSKAHESLDQGGILNWVRSSNNFMVGDPFEGLVGRMNPLDDEIAEYVKLFDGNAWDPNRTPLESLRHVDGILSSKVLELRRGMGQTGDIQQPQSAFVAMTLVLGILQNDPDGLGWRPSLRDLQSVFQKATGTKKSDRVEVTLSAVFFAIDTVVATEHTEAFRAKLVAQPWCLDVKPFTTTPTEDEGGISVEGMKVTIDVEAYHNEKTKAAGV
ncbi:MAG: Tfp pilus assembly PilM family ATPase [Planctomycetota bacterium]|jgi:Tfp pilus assembly PilM family ATPase